MTAKKNMKYFRINSKARVFLILLVLAAIYWFFTSLSEKYIYLTSYKINYINVPENLLFQNTPSQQIQVQIEATGFEILAHNLKSKSLTFDVSEFNSAGNYKYYYLTNNQKHTIQKRLNDIKLIQFSKDSLIVFLGNLKSKKVPIVSEIKLNFRPGFKLSEILEIKPDSITIKGPEKFIDDIYEIKTNVIEKNDIYSDINLEIPLLLPTNQENKLVFDSSKVTLFGKVAKYTEGTKVLPIELPTLPDGIKMELYPKVATIKYEVSFENYQKIDSTSFIITCDYPMDSLKHDEAINLYLSKKPKYINEYSIEPQEVTYLIQQIK